MNNEYNILKRLDDVTLSPFKTRYNYVASELDRKLEIDNHASAPTFISRSGLVSSLDRLAAVRPVTHFPCQFSLMEIRP